MLWASACPADEETTPPCTTCDAPASLSVGEGHACVVTEAGRVACWGANDAGQLGLGHTRTIDPLVDGLAFVDLGSGRTALAVAAGPQFTCALLADASVKCWGLNGSGQLGLGDTDSRGDQPDEMGDALAAVRDESGGVVLARWIAAGQGTACAIRTDDRITCWGNNSYGQLGPAETAVNVPIPRAAVEVGAGLVPQQIQIGGPGGAHVCVVLAGPASGLKCWGYNGVGALGQGDTDPLAPSEFGDAMPWVDLGSDFGPAPDQATIADLAVGHRSTCARAPNGVVKCWGYGKYGLGSGDDDIGNQAGEMGDALGAVPLPGPAAGLFAGGFHFCAILDDGTVTCWGRNDAGQLGLNAADDRGNEPGEALAPADSIRRARAGGGDELATCALDDTGELRCWGGGVLGGGLGDAPGEMASVKPFPSP